jgi:exopolyphosphatase/pppGpp-phosphohydrolase
VLGFIGVFNIEKMIKYRWKRQINFSQFILLEGLFYDWLEPNDLITIQLLKFKKIRKSTNRTFCQRIQFHKGLYNEALRDFKTAYEIQIEEKPINYLDLARSMNYEDTYLFE